ncbi:MAG: hypothetical protein WDZ28_03710, partial [Simkaniaceae bacterium]
ARFPPTTKAVGGNLVISMSKIFIIELCGDSDLEGMAIDITYDNETVATINYEKGIDNIEVEIPSQPKKFVFSLDSFLVVLEKAKKLAKKCAKEDKNLRKKGIDF